MANLAPSDAMAAAALEAAARREPCARVRVRMLAVRHLLAGHSPDEAAGVFGLSRSSLFRLRARHAAGGIAALYDRPRSGAPQRLARRHEAAFVEDDGYLVFYTFDESQLDKHGECTDDAKSELWVLDARSMTRVECKIQLPTRIPYGLHGNWFTEEQIARQKGVEKVRTLPPAAPAADTQWSRIKRSIHGRLG